MNQADASPEARGNASTKPSSVTTGRPGCVALVAGNLVAAVLAAIALFFAGWFLALNLVLPDVFNFIAAPWRFGGGSMDWAGLSWGLGAVVLFAIFGWFFLEGLELYLPRSATLALAYLFGMGLVGFVLECLAIPYLLSRVSIAIGMIVLLGLLALPAWTRARRPPESGLGGEAGPAEHLMRRSLARQADDRSKRRPQELAERLFRSVALLLIGAITAAIFWHALLYPEVYWDSLILYLGYARKTFLDGGFPVKVTGQVGIGLGANYPHLYAVLGSGVATAAGQWSELPQRLMAPLAGLATTVLIYHTALRLTRHVNFSLAIALLYRSVPLGIAYDTYATDYALALLFAAGFLYLALRTIESGMRGYLIAATLLIALAMHLNYLMGILWVPWAVTVWVAHAGWGGRMNDPGTASGAGPDDESDTGCAPQAPWTVHPYRPDVRALLHSGWFWGTLILAAVIGSTWHLRNWIVTGNPVYAFFYEFLGGKNISPEVMAAANQEWIANGAGIARLGITTAERLRALPEFIAGSVRWSRQGVRLMPLAMAFSLGGLIVWFGRWITGPLTGSRRSIRDRIQIRFGLVVAVLAVGLLAFHVVLAPFYLYQIIKLLPCLALMVAFAWPLWQLRPWRWLYGGLVIWTGLVPGLAMALMGFKVFDIQMRSGQTESPLYLFPLRNPLPRTEIFYSWRYGDDPLMWYYVNRGIERGLKLEKLLTHENRHLVLDPSIQLIHLDDWEMQALWDVEPPRERVRRLIEEFDIHYYLYVPNEEATPTNARMGTKEWPELGLAELEITAGPNRLYRLKLPPTHPPSEAPPQSEPVQGEP